jgi:acetyltransferase
MSSSEVGPLGSKLSDLEEQVEHRGRRLTLRPIRPEDSPQHRQFLAQITPEDLYHRFFNGVRQLPEEELRHFTHIDYDREMAFIAVAPEGGEILGVARACADHARVNAEFAVLVRSDLKRQGLGTLLMRKLIQYCRDRSMRQLWGYVMTDNVPMMRLCRALGFRVRRTERNIAEITLDLQSIETVEAS